MRLYGPPAADERRTVTVQAGMPGAQYVTPGTEGKPPGEHQVPEHPAFARQRRQINELARWRAACAHVAAGGAPLVRGTNP